MTRTMPPDVSIIVPTLHAVNTVADALASITASASQASHLDIEILVVDGGSQDGTAEVVRRYPDVHLLRQQGRGLAAARNEGVAASRAPIVGFCDADDRWTPGALTSRLAARRTDPSCAMDGGWVTGWVHFVALEARHGGGLREPGDTHAGYTPGAILVHRDAFDEVGPFDPSLRIGADADWMMRAVGTLGRPCMTREIVLEKGLRADSLSTDVATYRRDMLRVARRFLDRRRGATSP